MAASPVRKRDHRAEHDILPIDSEYDIYSSYEFEFAGSQPPGRARRPAARGQCQPRRSADRAVAAGDEPRTAATARPDRRSPAGADRRADGADAAGAGAARSAGTNT